MLKTDEVEEVFEDSLMLSTIDNPYNPQTHYDEWKEWDEGIGYNTESYIARLLSMENIVDYDDELELNNAISKVISDILENDREELYILV